MAAATTTAMSHNIPPLSMSMSSAPRIRPPRIPKGTPNVNTDPQPEGHDPKGKVWVQGKWRDPASRAVRQRQEIYSRRVERALRHETLGTSIYAYNHIRTKQVVYSLSRNMENNKIMTQLLYHGKKTVPEAIRRDMWTPYFSVHFPLTEHGAEAGKLAYRRLRELSLQRQLSPPAHMVTATEKDINDMKSKYDPIVLKDMLEQRDLRLPSVGQLLPQKIRAKRLMDQKATSVADVHFVLGLSLKEPTPAELQRARLQKFRRRMAQMGRRAKTRLQKIRQLEARKRDLIRSLASRAQPVRKNDGHLTLTKHAAARVSSEYLGRSRFGGGLEKLRTIEAANKAKATEAELRESMSEVQTQIDALLLGQSIPETAAVKADEVELDGLRTSRTQTVANSKANNQTTPAVAETAAEQHLVVKMMWADERDTAYAPDEWPRGVYHGELERWAASKEVVDGGRGTKISRSVHVIGAPEDSNWAGSPKGILTKRQEREATMKKRQEAAKSVEGKIEQAVQLLREDLAKKPSQRTTGTIRELTKELRRDQTRLALTKEDLFYQRAALVQQWWALLPDEREGLSPKRTVRLAQFLKLRELQQAAAVDADVNTREKIARQDAAKVSKEDGVEVGLPKSGWFDRLKAVVWRR